jgi:hypothetical protein
MSEYNMRRWRAARLAMAREAVEEGAATYAEIVDAINAGEYAITAEEE